MSSTLWSTHSCHPITSAPRVRAGDISAAYMVTVAADCQHLWQHSLTFRSEPETHDQSRGEQSLPRVGETGSNGCSNKDNSGDEDLSSTAEPVVQRIRNFRQRRFDLVTHAKRQQEQPRCRAQS